MKAVTQIVWVFMVLICAAGYGAYLDAEGGASGNTARASDGDVNAWWTTATASDGLWGRRTGFANNPTGELGTPDNDVFEASGTGSGIEDGVQIVTTITGLNPGSLYKVDVVFWSSTSQNWAIRAGFDMSTSVYYDRLGADGATAGTATGKTEGDRAEYAGLVGYIEADENGEIKVYINDKPSNSSQGGWYDRTWYDGVLYEKFNIASDPTPADDPAGENPVSVNQDLGWDILDSNVEYIDLYLGLENEPNLVPAAGNKKLDFEPKTFSYDPGVLEFETVYYWRVDTYEPNTVPGSTDYVKAIGPVWTFKTVPQAPVVNPVTPAYTAVNAGESSVILSVTSLNVETFEWYKVGDPNPLGDEAGVYSGTGTDTLTIYDIQSEDEGYYYCVGSNSAGSDSSLDAETGEGTGRLLTKRLMSYWPMDSDNTAVVDGNDVMTDIVDGYDMVLASAVVEGEDAGQDYPILVSDTVDPVVGDESLLFNNSNSADPNNAWGQYALVDPGVAEYEDITIAVWVYWNGGGNWQRILDFGNGTAEYMFLSPNAAGTNLRFVVSISGEQNVQTSLMPTGEWVWVTVTLNGDTARMYVNGELVSTNSSFTHNPIGVTMAANYIGDSQFVADPYFNGMIDDLRIYNYARTTEQIALDYLGVRGEWICNNEAEALPYDYDDNCRIDLADFAIFAATWLDSNRIYP